LEDLEIKAKSQLSGVIIGEGVRLPSRKNVSLGAGVRFVKRQDIPTGLDLTPLLPSLAPFEDIEQPAYIDLEADVIVDGDGILAAINAIPDIVEANLTVHQNNDFGYLHAELEGRRYAVNCSTVQHTQGYAALQLGIAQTVRFQTMTQMNVLTQPAIQAPEALQAALAELGLPITRVKSTGNLQIRTTETAEIWYSARPDLASDEIEDDAETGLFLESLTEAFFVFADEQGRKREQLFYPAPADMLALRQKATSVDLTTEGLLRFSHTGKRYQGVLDYLVTQGNATNNGLTVRETADTNGDGLEDFLITYPDGAQQILWRLPTQ